MSSLSKKIAAKTAEIQKMSYNQETAAFINWVFLTRQEDPLSENMVVDFFKRNFGMEPRPYSKRDTSGPRWKIGDRIVIDTEKHAEGSTLDVYREYEGQEGTVVSTETQDRSLVNKPHSDVMVRMDNGREVRFPGAQRKTRVGMKTAVKPIITRKEGEVEAVYISASENIPTPRQIAIADAYVARGVARGEDRSRNFYTGFPQSLYISSSGDVLFSVAAQQRQEERQYGRRDMNPSKGKLLYLGMKGASNRPNGWQKEYAEILVKTEQILQDRGE